MRAFLHRSIIVALGLFAITAASAQSYSLRMGDKAYKELAYSEAIMRYEEAVKMGADTGAFIVRLAESYLNVRDFANAAKWYKYATTSRIARPNRAIGGGRQMDGRLSKESGRGYPTEAADRRGALCHGIDGKTRGRCHHDGPGRQL
jgi:hypothetical protein